MPARKQQDGKGQYAHKHLENISQDTVENLGWRQPRISGEMAALQAAVSEAMSWEIIRISQRTASVPEIRGWLHLRFS